MIKYLKFLWKKCFGSVGYSRIKEPTRDLAGTGSDLGLEPLVLKPKPEPVSLHCKTHIRFKKSCTACAEVTS